MFTVKQIKVSKYCYILLGDVLHETMNTTALVQILKTYSLPSLHGVWTFYWCPLMSAYHIKYNTKDNVKIRKKLDNKILSIILILSKSICSLHTCPTTKRAEFLIFSIEALVINPYI